MCLLYSMTRNREALLPVPRLSQPPRGLRTAVGDLPRLSSTRGAQGHRRCARARGAELGLRAVAEGQGAKAGDEHPGRQGTEQVLAHVFEQRRCLVPASSYCEPKGEKPATINGDDERPLFAFPGVWTRYRGPLKKNGENVDQEVFAFMTTEPNELTTASITSACRYCCQTLPTSRRGSLAQRTRRSSWRAAMGLGRCASCSQVPSARTCSRQPEAADGFHSRNEKGLGSRKPRGLKRGDQCWRGVTRPPTLLSVRANRYGSAKRWRSVQILGRPWAPCCLTR